MKIVRSDGEKLVIVDFPYLIGLICVAAGAALIGHSYYLWKTGTVISDHTLIGNAATGLFFLLVAAIFTKRCAFTFDRARRQLVWSRIGVFRWKRGTVPFSQIRDVVIQTSLSGSALTYRLAMIIAERDLPLTKNYTRADKASVYRCHAAIREALGLPPTQQQRSEIDQVKALIIAGRPADAITLVRKNRGCGLAEAKTIVEGMK